MAVKESLSKTDSSGDPVYETVPCRRVLLMTAACLTLTLVLGGVAGAQDAPELDPGTASSGIALLVGGALFLSNDIAADVGSYVSFPGPKVLTNGSESPPDFRRRLTTRSRAAARSI